MKKWLKRTLLLVALVLAVVLLLSGVAVSLFHGTPAWYEPGSAWGGPAGKGEAEQLARSAENKLIDAQNWGAAVVADARRARAATRSATRPGGTTPAPRAAESHEIAFSQDELNALFDKWSTAYGWRDKYSAYLDDPRIVLHEGKLILAGRLKELGAIASFQFRPSVDASGRLRLDLVRVTGGRLPLPDVVWVKWRDQIAAALRQRMPQWRAEAKIDPTGAANTAAMAATFSQLFFAVADGQAAEPVLFMPLIDRGQSVPVRVTAVSVSDDKLTLRAEPLTPAQRAALLEHIKSAPASPVAQASSGR
jgi:hypothetical protein